MNILRRLFYIVLTLICIIFIYIKGYSIENGFTYSEIRSKTVEMVLLVILPVIFADKLVSKIVEIIQKKNK